jgi:Heterokaryon incompatibility protein (HET)
LEREITFPDSSYIQQNIISTSAMGSELPKPEPHENQIKPVAKRIKLGHETQLCDECATLDFEKIFKDAEIFFSEETSNRPRHRSKWTSEGFYIAALGNRPAPWSTCLLCRLFWTMKIGGKNLDKYELRAFSSLASSHFIQPRFIPPEKRSIVQKAFLAVVPAQSPHLSRDKWRSVGTLFRAISSGAQSDGMWGREITERVDFTTVREWLDFCQKNHRGTCTRPVSCQNIHLQGFRLIDCDTNPPKIERCTGTEKYVALSYVWGSHSGDSSPSAWPNVILDAITATKRLGLKYLWADRFCIDQKNIEEQHFLISKMDSIYEAAEVTIIAAAGLDANSGLPGIGSIPRRPQPQAKIGNTLLVSTLGDPREHIRNSVWSTRGWTYQEGVLSRRRLVFTEEQVYFECGGMVTHESIYLPLSLYHTKNRLRMERFMLPGIFDGKPRGWYNFQTKGLNDEAKLIRLGEHIMNFTRRKLSYDSDSLLAFQGISQRYCSEQKTGIHMIYGLPVWVKNGNLMRSFALAVAVWSHTPWSGGRNETTEFPNHKRRWHLPSWTWAGWSGGITMSPDNNPLSTYSHTIGGIINPRNGHSYSAEICLTRSNGQLIDELSFDSPQHCCDDIAPVFRINQPYFLEQVDLKKATSGLLLYDWEVSISLSVQGNISSFQKNIKDGLWKCLLIYSTSFVFGGVFFLIVERSKVDEDREVWIRVGTMAVYFQEKKFDILIRKLYLVPWASEICIG